MKRSLLPILLLFLTAASLSAQKLPKPTQLSNSLTDAQRQILNAGIKLHDSKQYDEAIALYEKILQDNPDAAEVIYEKAMSLYTKGDKVKAMETAYVGAKYKSDQLALFYTMMASCLDDVGKSDEAVQIYRQAKDMLKGDIGMRSHLSSVYYNLGVTYVRQKKYDEARAELKRSISTDFAYPGPNYILALVYNGTKYKVPAFAAAARFISLETNTQRSANAAAIIAGVVKPAEADPKTGNYQINLDFNEPKDEGDYGMYGLILGTLGVTDKDKDKKKDEGKTTSEKFVDSVNTLVGFLADDKKIKDTFVGKNYVPFLAEMKKKGYTETLAYLVMYRTGEPSAKSWIQSNDAKVAEFTNWAKSFRVSDK